jgi:hypothetical protein
MATDERGPVGWQPIISKPTIRALEAAGLVGEQLLVALQELKDAGVLVSAGYYIPTTDELFREYNALGYAYLTGRINVRWVMCAETHDALIGRYARTKYAGPPNLPPSWWSEVSPSPEVLEMEVRTAMERQKYWGDSSQLFGIPIRSDPAARRPAFEIVPMEERGTDGN